jgi:hypothetical protein
MSDNGQTRIAPAMIEAKPGDKFIFMKIPASNDIDKQEFQFLGSADLSVPEMLNIFNFGLASIVRLIAKDPRFAPSPIIQPYAGPKKIG